MAKTLLTTPGFVAVPQSRNATLPATAPSTSNLPPPPGILGQPVSPSGDEFSEPESSLFDYQQMDELGLVTQCLDIIGYMY